MQRVQRAEMRGCRLMLACHDLLAGARRLREAHPELPSAALAVCCNTEVNGKLRTYADMPATRERKGLCVRT